MGTEERGHDQRGKEQPECSGSISFIHNEEIPKIRVVDPSEVKNVSSQCCLPRPVLFLLLSHAGIGNCCNLLMSHSLHKDSKHQIIHIDLSISILC